MACQYTYQGKTYEAHEFDDVLRAMKPAEASKFMPTVRAIPDAPMIGTTDAWLNLSLKRVVTLAVDGGYDKVAFISGDQSAERYDLSKQIQAVRVSIDQATGNYEVHVTEIGQDRETWVPIDGGADAEQLAATIGKDLAAKAIADLNERIAASDQSQLPEGFYFSMDRHTEPERPFTVIPPGQEHAKPFAGRHATESEAIAATWARFAPTHETVTYTGVDLRIGGEGMKAFYDTIVPNTLNSLLRKLGGEKATTVQIQSADSQQWGVYDATDDGNQGLLESFPSKASADEYAAEQEGGVEVRQIPQYGRQVGFEINATMRQKASEGLPMFARDGIQGGMSVLEATNALRKITGTWANAPILRVVDSYRDIPFDLPSDTRGHFQRGTIWIVASAHKDAEALARTYGHEAVAHHGLRDMLGVNAWQRFMDQIQTANEDGNETIRSISEEVRQIYVDDNGNFNLSREQEADEIAARIVEKAIDPKTGQFRPGLEFVAEVYSKVAGWLRDVVHLDIPFTTLELNGVLVSARKHLQREAPANDESLMEFAFGDEEGMSARSADAAKPAKGRRTEKTPVAKKPFHETVAEKLIEKLREGTAPWQKPWRPGQNSGLLPMNPTTGKRYKGINAIHLMNQGFTDHRWLTYKQAAAMDAQVRKGQSGTAIQYWKFTDEIPKLDENGNQVFNKDGEPVKMTVKLERPRVFFATVFNAEQIDGMPVLTAKQPPSWVPIERAEAILKASGAAIMHGEANRAFYRPGTDSIHMPSKEQFPTADSYYAIAMHELGHWTGHESRLDRDLSNPFGSEGYAKEELRAEIASMILGDELQLGHDPDQHAAYVGAWIKILQDDPIEVFRAAADAEKIHDHILAFEQKLLQEQAPERRQADKLQTILAELQELHLSAYPGYSPMESWQNLQTAAAKNGLVASIQRGGDGQYDPPYLVSYKTVDGEATGITTDLHKDGKAVTCNDGVRVPGTGLTAEDEWQSDALTNAAVHFKNKSVAKENTMPQEQPQPPAPTPVGHPEAFIDMNGMLKSWNTADRMPEDWQGVAKAGDKYLYVGQVNGQRRIVELAARSFDEALVEAGVSPVQKADPVKPLSSMEQPRLSTMDTPVAMALLAARKEQSASHLATLAELSKYAFGFEIPANWTGQTATRPLIEEGNPIHDEIDEMGVYALLEDGSEQILAKFYEAHEIDNFVDRLAVLDAYAQPNQLDRDVRLANIILNRVSHDPEASDADISTAKDNRTNAEVAALIASSKPTITSGNSESIAGLNPQREKTYIQVPFKQKEEAKALGAKWDRQEQSWYIPATLDLAAFAKWTAPKAAQTGEEAAAGVPTEVQPSQPKPTPTVAKVAKEARQYLAVPFEDRIAAKAAGALWDNAAKSWYAGPNADLQKLDRWQADKVPGQQAPAMSPEEEFGEALTSLGCVVDGEHPIMDGKKHRISVVGDKGAEKAGFYVGHLDGHPAGYIKNNKTGLDMKWKSKGYTLDPEQKAQLQAEAAAKLQARAAEQEATHERTAQRMQYQMSQLVPASAESPYLKAKGIALQPGVFADAEGATTFIPATDIDGKQWTMQYIKEDGIKRFAKDSRKEGCFHVVGGIEHLASLPVLVIAEGYATAASISETVGHGTIAAFDSGNLLEVAKSLRARYPDKPIVIAGDDDKHLELTQGVNPGRSKAQEAAKAVGGKVLLPIFAPGEANYPKELPPVTPQAYREHLSATKTLEDAQNEPERVQLTEQQTAKLKSAQLSAEQLAALNAMKRHTDFNDLATKSALGRDGLKRQVNPIVEAVVAKKVAAQPKPEQQIQVRKSAALSR